MRKRSVKYGLALPAVLLVSASLLSGCGAMVLDPKGPVGAAQKDLILFTVLLCAVILVPVLALTAFIIFRYRDRPGSRASYRPDWSHNHVMEIVWWGIPIVIIGILAVVTVRGSHDLEPSKPLVSDREPLVIQVTSLDWKWLFQYPEQGIATVNYLYIPEDVPVEFQLTSDAPMNSFWIPQLGGQIYTMSGMAMKLNLQADEPGTYYGSGANFSGEHFADMTFKANAVSDEEFEAWVNEVKTSSPPLTEEGYQELAKPGTTDELSFAGIPEGLFHQIVNKYAVGGSAHSGHGMPKAAEAPKTSEAAPEATGAHHAHGGH